MTHEELTAHWPEAARDAVREHFDCQECGMHAADYDYFLHLEAENAALRAQLDAYTGITESLPFTTTE